jgi:hypothetical protein
MERRAQRPFYRTVFHPNPQKQLIRLFGASAAQAHFWNLLLESVPTFSVLVSRQRGFQRRLYYLASYRRLLLAYGYRGFPTNALPLPALIKAIFVFAGHSMYLHLRILRKFCARRRLMAGENRQSDFVRAGRLSLEKSLLQTKGNCDNHRDQSPTPGTFGCPGGSVNPALLNRYRRAT